MSPSTFPQSFALRRYTIPASPKREVTPHKLHLPESLCSCLPAQAGCLAETYKSQWQIIASTPTNVTRKCRAAPLALILMHGAAGTRKSLTISSSALAVWIRLRGVVMRRTQVIAVTLRLLCCFGLVTCLSSLISVRPHFRIRRSLISP